MYLFDFLRNTTKFRLGTRSDQHGGAFRREPLGDGAAYATPAAGNYRNFAFEKHGFRK